MSHRGTLSRLFRFALFQCCLLERGVGLFVVQAHIIYSRNDGFIFIYLYEKPYIYITFKAHFSRVHDVFLLLSSSMILICILATFAVINA